jgi:hypothetical protein
VTGCGTSLAGKCRGRRPAGGIELRWRDLVGVEKVLKEIAGDSMRRTPPAQRGVAFEAQPKESHERAQQRVNLDLADPDEEEM